MDAEPVKEAADPAREAEKAPPTVLHGTLTVEVPGGETMVLKTTFDSGSNTDAVSEKVAIQLKKLGVPWGEAGGGVSMAVSSSVAVPHGELRLLLSAEPSGSDGRADELAIPRPLQFVTDALIMKDLSNDLIIGWQLAAPAVVLSCGLWFFVCPWPYKGPRQPKSGYTEPRADRRGAPSRS